LTLQILGGTLKIEEGAHPIFWGLKILSDLSYILNTEVTDYSRFAAGEEGLYSSFDPKNSEN